MSKITGAIVVVIVLIASAFLFNVAKHRRVEATYQAYVDYFKAAYDILDKNYYIPVNQDVFKSYIAEFKKKIFEPQVKDKTRVDSGIKHIGTGILVARLKDPADSFTNFFPPQMVKAFKEDALGMRGDIGIDGILKDGVYTITQVEPRSDALKKGIAVGDQIVKIENKPVLSLTAEVIRNIFSPPLGQEVALDVLSSKTNAIVSFKVLSTQYFKQSVFLFPTADASVACIQLKFFNESTGSEMRGLIEGLNKKNISKLIIDLRNNGGGPPLAAWDISGIFLEPEQKLFYFLKRNSAPMGLLSSPSPVKYNGAMAVLTNKGTGSAAELFAGILQSYKRAQLIGENSAGKVFLKSIFDLSDGATMEVTVAKGYLFTGNPIDAGGLKPDVIVTDSEDLLNFAVGKMK